MVSYATVSWLISLFAVMFVYTLLWDLYQSFWDLAVEEGVSGVIMGFLYTLHDWLPIIFLFSSTFWYLSQTQTRPVIR